MTGKLTRRAALGLVATGSVLSISESRSFSQLVAGRGVAVSTAADPDALLGVSGVSDPGTIPTFTNRSNDSMVVTLSSSDSSVEFDVGNTGSFTSDPAPFEITDGATVEVGISGDSESVPVDVVADLQRNGESVGSIELQREFSVSQAGQVQVTPNVKSAGNSGKYRYELENTGEIDVTIKALSIVETTNQNADRVDKGDILSVSGVDGSTGEGDVRDDPIPVDGTFASLDPNVSLPTGVAKSFEFDRFRTLNSKNADMQGHDVKIRLKFTDDSTLLVKLCLNGCDF